MSHKDRMSNLASYALPPKSHPMYEKIVSRIEKDSTPESDKLYKRLFDEAIATLKIQLKNGAGFEIDNDLRYFLEEFNNRAFNVGLRSMPSSFNVMEAFFNHIYRLNAFQLLDEEDYLVNFIDFIDFVTSDKCPPLNESASIFEEDVIYNFSCINNPVDIDFSLVDNTTKYLIGGISLVKRDDEISILLLAGEKSPHEIADLDLTDAERTPGKEELEIPNNAKSEKIRFLELDDYWKVLIMLRFNMSSCEVDAKIIGKDMGSHFSVVSDCLESFTNESGEFISENLETAYKKLQDEIVNYYPLFEIGKYCIHLLSYVDFNEEDLVVEKHITTFGKEPIKPKHFKKDKLVNPKYEIKIKDVFVINRDKSDYPSRTILYDDSFKMETEGYWKRLRPDEIGKNKNGEEIHGKTWVSVTKVWHELKHEPIAVHNNLSVHNITQNAGYIYIMRNASHDKDIFKVGLTRRNSDIRATEVTKGTGVPDKFLVAEDWQVKDCVVAERIIHEKLDGYRINEKREFFKAPYKIIRATVEEVVNEINAN